MTDIAETDHTALLVQLEGADAIATWSDDRRNEFCNTFKNRADVTRYLLLKTAQLVHEAAERRSFISQKHDKAIVQGFLADSSRGGRLVSVLFHNLRDGLGSNHHHKIGDRTTSSLVIIAEKRAEEIISQLPSLSKAVRVIDVETAKKIDRKDKIRDDCEALRVKLDELCVAINMKDLDQSMTIGAFLKMVADKEAERDKLQKKFQTLADEGRKLEAEISKTLFAGLPGLSDAVVDVIRNYVEQFIAMETTTRRVQERVKFGDSQAALELLQNFEKDETEVSDKVRQQFAKALEVLKVSKPAKASKPALKAVPKAKKRAA